MQNVSRLEGFKLLLSRAFHKPSISNPLQAQKLLPSTEVIHGCPSMSPPKAGPGTMAKSLVKTVMGLSDVKEDVYGALDAWAAFELNFPMVATRKALERLRVKGEWHRIIQITKWMLSKGVGRTHNIYLLLLKAYCMDGRLEDAEELWDKISTMHGRSMPKIMFAFFTNVLRKKGKPEKVIKVFEQMESYGIKPDPDLLRRAKEAYQELEMHEKAELLGKKYAFNARIRRKEKRREARKASKASNGKPTSLIEERDIICEQNDDDDDNDDDVEEFITPLQIERAMDDGNKVEEVKTAQGSRMKASSSADARSSCCEDQKRRKKSDGGGAADEEFVKQIVATMESC